MNRNKILDTVAACLMVVSIVLVLLSKKRSVMNVYCDSVISCYMYYTRKRGL